MVTHGNGPQVGELADALSKSGSPLSGRLDVVGAMTQGELGYLISKSIRSVVGRDCVCVLTTVLVSEEDPAFSNPTKPIGRYLEEEELPSNTPPNTQFREKLVGGRRLYRRVVPSPTPLKVFEAEAIRVLLEGGYVVVACGGGGVPVAAKDHSLVGLNAVIDKDLASSLLAVQLDASMLIILTAVDSVMWDYGKPTQRPIATLTTEEAQRCLEQGLFEEGAIAPKIQACVEYTAKTGRDSFITSPEKLEEALRGRAGTRIISQK